MPAPLYAASPSKLLAFLDCPRRYRLQYLDRPAPEKRRQRAHTSLGIAVHNALRDWWDLPERTPAAGAGLVDRAWIDVGFRDGEQSPRVARADAGRGHGLPRRRRPGRPAGRHRAHRVVRQRRPAGERAGRPARRPRRRARRRRLQDLAGWRPPTTTPAPRWPLGLYAAAVWKMFRRRTLRVELHHVPTGTVAAHEHTPESLTRKVEQARSIARDARRAELDFAERGESSESFPPRPGPAVRVVRPARALPRGPGGRAREVRLGRTRGAAPGRWMGASATARTGIRGTGPSRTGRLSGPLWQARSAWSSASRS